MFCEVWIRVAACSPIALAKRGWQCPVDSTPMPAGLRACEVSAGNLERLRSEFACPSEQPAHSLHLRHDAFSQALSQGCCQRSQCDARAAAPPAAMSKCLWPSVVWMYDPFAWSATSACRDPRGQAQDTAQQHLTRGNPHDVLDKKKIVKDPSTTSSHTSLRNPHTELCATAGHRCRSIMFAASGAPPLTAAVKDCDAICAKL